MFIGYIIYIYIIFYIFTMLQEKFCISATLTFEQLGTFEQFNFSKLGLRMNQ